MLLIVDIQKSYKADYTNIYQLYWNIYKHNLSLTYYPEPRSTHCKVDIILITDPLHLSKFGLKRLYFLCHKCTSDLELEISFPTQMTFLQKIKLMYVVDNKENQTMPFQNDFKNDSVR